VDRSRRQGLQGRWRRDEDRGVRWGFESGERKWLAMAKHLGVWRRAVPAGAGAGEGARGNRYDDDAITGACAATRSRQLNVAQHCRANGAAVSRFRARCVFGFPFPCKPCPSRPCVRSFPVPPPFNMPGGVARRARTGRGGGRGPGGCWGMEVNKGQLSRRQKGEARGRDAQRGGAG